MKFIGIVRFFNNGLFMQNPSIDYLSLLLGAFFISFSGVWVTWAGVDPTVSGFYRAFFGAFFLFVACLLRREFSALSKGYLLLIVFCGFSFALDLYCWHLSILYIGPGLATILGNFQVFILTVISVLFFKERLNLGFVISVPLAVLGLFLVIGFNWSALPAQYQFGILMGLATALCYSVFLLSLRKIQANQDKPLFFFNLLLISLSTSFFLALLIVFSDISFSLPTYRALGSLACLGLFSQTIGWAFIAHSLPKVRPSVAGLVLLLQPALSFLWDVLIFSRETTLMNWAGVAIVLAAIYLGLTSTQTKK